MKSKDDDDWVTVGELVNGKPWQYKRLINPECFAVRYATVCGDWIEKAPSYAEAVALLGELPDINDKSACIMCGYCVIEDDSLTPNLLGAAGDVH